MTTVIGGVASTAWPAATLYAASLAARVHQCVGFAGVICAGAVRCLSRSVSSRKEALMNRLENFALEAIAAIILLAIFMILTDPATRNDH